MRRIVKEPYDDVLFPHHNVANRAIISPIEGKGLCTRGMRKDLPNDPAMHDRHDQLVRVRISQAMQAAQKAFAKLVKRFGSGDYIPALLLLHLDIDGIIVMRFDSEHAAFPLTQIHFPQIGFYDGFKTEMGKVNITEVAQKRGEVRDAIKAVMYAAVKDILHVEVTDFQIPNIDYTPSFRKAVEQAAIAKTLVEKALQQKRAKIIQAETAKIEAEGKANAAREAAKGRADATLFQAKATAARIRLEGEAKADAILKQARALGNNPLLVEYRKAEQWKGNVPQWTGAAGVPIINLSPPRGRKAGK